MSDTDAEIVRARRLEAGGGGSQNLEIAVRAGDADKLRARLVELAESRALAVSEYGARIAIAPLAGVRRFVFDMPADNGRGELRAQTHAHAAGIGEGVQAAGDFAAGFADEQVGALQQGRVKARVAAGRQDAPDALLDAVPNRRLIRREVAHAA